MVQRDIAAAAAGVRIFAYDHETIIVAECKSCEKRTKRQLQKDLGDFVANQKPIANTLRRFLGSDFKQKIIWFFVTKNIEWSQPDLARAEEANIKVVTEKDLFYYKEIAKRIGKAARYQFHAEFLANTKVHALERKVFAMRTKLGAYKAYTFFASAETILPIAFVNHRDLRDPNAAPSYQRLVHRPRLKDIAAYLANGGFFPNAIILNFKKRIRFDLLKPEDEFGITPGEMTLPDTYKSAWIIDGQHRLNVPRGTKDTVIFDDDDFSAVSEVLASTKIMSGDFEKILCGVKEDDFVFIDPPYTVKHNCNGFVKYNESIFSWNDQVRLAEAVKSKASSGASILVTNAYHPTVVDLYTDFATIVPVERASILSGDKSYRGRTHEALILVGSAWKDVGLECMGHATRSHQVTG